MLHSEKFHGEEIKIFHHEASDFTVKRLMLHGATLAAAVTELQQNIVKHAIKVRSAVTI